MHSQLLTSDLDPFSLLTPPAPSINSQKEIPGFGCNYKRVAQGSDCGSGYIDLWDKIA